MLRLDDETRQIKSEQLSVVFGPGFVLEGYAGLHVYDSAVSGHQHVDLGGAPTLPLVLGFEYIFFERLALQFDLRTSVVSLDGYLHMGSPVASREERYGLSFFNSLHLSMKLMFYFT